nr:MAG TPA: Regulatory protein [Bacteriophage sp.]
MVNTQAVLARMKELGMTQKTIANLWDCAQSTVSLKLGNKRPLLLDEALKLQAALQISDAEFCSYFLSPEVA